MRYIIKSLPNNNEIVVSTETSINKYYGVEFDTNIRGFISRREFETGYFTIFSTDKLTGGNGWDYYDKQSLPDIIDMLIDNNYKVFEFDTFKELMEWICKMGFYHNRH